MVNREIVCGPADVLGAAIRRQNPPGATEKTVVRSLHEVADRDSRCITGGQRGDNARVAGMAAEQRIAFGAWPGPVLATYGAGHIESRRRGESPAEEPELFVGSAVARNPERDWFEKRRRIVLGQRTGLGNWCVNHLGIGGERNKEQRGEEEET